MKTFYFAEMLIMGRWDDRISVRVLSYGITSKLINFLLLILDFHSWSWFNTNVSHTDLLLSARVNSHPTEDLGFLMLEWALSHGPDRGMLALKIRKAHHQGNREGTVLHSLVFWLLKQQLRAPQTVFRRVQECHWVLGLSVCTVSVSPIQQCRVWEVLGETHDLATEHKGTEPVDKPSVLTASAVGTLFQVS